jgi:hypothetical protein
MPPAGFEPAIPAKERPQNNALDRTATGIGHSYYKLLHPQDRAKPTLKETSRYSLTFPIVRGSDLGGCSRGNE